ncbi:hypothetical protein HBH49_231140 [Parastagonospora nodorum]|nr:hypothetical protein HBH49_231140 [Parastagonospora nodorum]
MLDFMQDMLDDIYPGSRKTWDNSTTLVTQESSTIISLLFISKAPFALHFICAVCNLVILAQYKSYDEDTLIHPSIKCWRSSGKRHNDPEYCDEEVLYLILIIIDYTCYDKDRKHIAYIRVFSEVLLFNNNRQINNTTRMLTFKFYDLSTIICLVHLVPRDLPNLITYTTMSYYVNNYIDWDEYNCLYLLTFNIDLLRTLREY